MSDTEQLRTRLTVLDAQITYTADLANELYERADSLRREYAEVATMLREAEQDKQEEL